MIIHASRQSNGLALLRRVLLSLAVAANCTAMLHAQTSEPNPPDEKAVKMQQLTVTGETSARKDLAPDSITNPFRVETSAQVGSEVFNRDDIQNIMPKDLNDLLDKATGLNVTYQGRKNPFFVSQRGGGTFSYIVDGAFLPPSTNRILYKIPMSAVEEMQVVRGATSLTLGPCIPIGSSNSGSGLNTGYVILRTRRPDTTEVTMKASIEQSTGGQPLAHSESLFVGTSGNVTSSVDGYVGALASNMDRPSKDTWFDGTSSYGGMVTMGFNVKGLSVHGMAYHDQGRFEMQRGVKPDGTLDTSKWYYAPLRTTVIAGDATLEWTPNRTALWILRNGITPRCEPRSLPATPRWSGRPTRLRL
jgi:hypothetical protein